MSPSSINHNLMAYGVSRQLEAHYGKLADSMRRLSTGLRVERAADDAAGLAIRELMRADILALGQGVRNANDAISLIQTADGALQIIDEKLIRMKELAEQAATGTYDSTQRLMIDSEFQQMASEIDRIAKATDFNGVKLLDGSLAGPHDGSGRGSEDGLSSTGALKVHFGTANDSAEDYYYVEIGDCTLAGLGLRGEGIAVAAPPIRFGHDLDYSDYGNDPIVGNLPGGQAVPPNMTDIITQQWENYYAPQDFMMIIPKGTENFVIYSVSSTVVGKEEEDDWEMDNDLQLFTKSGVHLAGTKYVPGDPDKSDPVWYKNWTGDNSIEGNKGAYGFGDADYDGSHLNSGPGYWTLDVDKLQHSQYNGMNIYYGGDYEAYDDIPNNMRPSGPMNSSQDYELLMIDRVTEDLILSFPGAAGGNVKVAWGERVTGGTPQDPTAPAQGGQGHGGVVEGEIVSIRTQEAAQKALARLDTAIVIKDKIRAHLGATQNRLENTVTNLTVQAESLQAAESRISDVDVATEMTTLVRNQVLTQSAVSMLAQANAFPHMLLRLLQE